jgi:hypothetical protein
MSEVRDAYFREVDELARNFLNNVRAEFPGHRMYLGRSPECRETFWLYVEGLNDTDELETYIVNFCFDTHNVNYLDIFPLPEFQENHYLYPLVHGVIV